MKIEIPDHELRNYIQDAEAEITKLKQERDEARVIAEGLNCGPQGEEMPPLPWEKDECWISDDQAEINDGP